MLWLGIDTSGSRGSVALCGEKEAILFYRTVKGHFEQIDAAIEELFSRARVDMEELDGIAVVSGPGYFTGLRVGVAYAKGLAMALSRPLAFVPSFEAMLFAVPDGRFLLGIDMGREKCCVLKIVKQEGKVVERKGPYHMRKEELEAFVHAHRGWSACGEPFVKFNDIVPLFMGGPDAKMAASAGMNGVVPVGTFMDTKVQYECPAGENKKSTNKNIKGGVAVEPWEIEKIQALIEKDDELKKLWEEHLEYERKIEALQSKRYLTPEEELELKRLKKEKLAGKDKIYSILRKYQEAS